MISYDLFFKSFNPILVHRNVYLGAYFLETLFIIYDKSYLYWRFSCLLILYNIFLSTQPYDSMKFLNYCCKIKNKSLEELLMSNMLK
jgi:hypothetical protein